MNAQFVFLVEEPSTKALLDGLLPRILPPRVPVVVVPHEGKRDLEASLPRKLRGWRTPGACFFVVRDQDHGDCKSVKARLLGICQAADRPDAKVRIACREMESWLLGDLDSLARIFRHPAVLDLGAREKFRNPDALGNPSEEIRKLISGYKKIAGARAMGPAISLEQNQSRSFLTFVEAVRVAAASLGDEPAR